MINDHKFMFNLKVKYSKIVIQTLNINKYKINSNTRLNLV